VKGQLRTSANWSEKLVVDANEGVPSMPPGNDLIAEQITGKLCEAEVELSRGKKGPEMYRKIGVTEQTHYRWKKEHGGLRMNQAKRLKNLERKTLKWLFVTSMRLTTSSGEGWFRRQPVSWNSVQAGHRNHRQQGH
jgi:putative transposase